MKPKDIHMGFGAETDIQKQFHAVGKLSKT